jgi:hypothetical protein
MTRNAIEISSFASLPRPDTRPMRFGPPLLITRCSKSLEAENSEFGPPEISTDIA